MKTTKAGKTNVTTSWKRLLLVLVLIITSFCFCGCGGEDKDPPLTITFRESMVNSSRVMQLTNRSGHETLVAQVLVRDKNGNRISHVTKLAPGATEEVGYLQAGFNFNGGGEFEVICDGYSGSISGTVP